VTAPKASAARGGKAAAPTPVESVRHEDKRKNIPTDELRSFAPDEDEPQKQRYPRDPSLDPQLVWKGKDEQDAEDLAVQTVPIYIQEKVEPRALIENLRNTAGPGELEPELTLFDDFDGLEFEQLVDFYEHEQNWANRLILGDSLLVMNSLAEKEGLRGKVQTVYLDPPYGIKFGSNWQVSTRKRDVKDGKAEDASRQPEQIKAFRDTWELGVSSYLTYLRDRLTVVRELLTESGSCFVQIGDENVHLVRSMMDEVFGSENFVSQIVFRKTTGKASAHLDNTYDVLLWYARDREEVKVRRLYRARRPSDDPGNFRFVETDTGGRRRMTAAELDAADSLPAGWRVFRMNPLTSQTGSSTTTFPFELDGHEYRPRTGGWKTNLEGMRRLETANRLTGSGETMSFVRFIDDFAHQAFSDIWDDTRQSGFGEKKVYVVQTATRVTERCLLMTTDPGDLVVDPTCGSGTTAVVAEKHGRRWITTDTSRVALALARQRLMAARHPSYLLADSPEGQKQEKRLSGAEANGQFARDIRKGFVYKRVPHITLKSIAQNPEITDGMSREEIDAAIARNADQELLYDQPYEQKGTVRVTGRFTVESLSPHRLLDWEEPPETASHQDADRPFATTVLDNLAKAGVQNTVRDEHLAFDWIEPFAGVYVGARGEYTDKGGEARRVAVSIGPEHGTVGSAHVKEAAKEALKGEGFDLLLVCAFSFDAGAGETAAEFKPDDQSGWAVAVEEKPLGRLPVLLVRMNPDLAMGDELLKKTGAGNLFMVFGEPDLEIERDTDGRLVVELRGVDVYDPTTGVVRSNTTDDVACWMIDTAYDGESFFVRHAYFTGAGDPYAQLKRALKADIDEGAWASLYQTRSRPFDIPETGRIAVKVINHYGDEVLKTYEV
jgi:adenine-specific DNA-methyltransferase